MIVQEPSSFTCTIRRLCEQIEAEIAALVKKTALALANASPHAPAATRTLFERTIEELNRAIVQTLTARLPALITLQEETIDRLEDLTSEREEYRQKYRRIFSQYEGLQLENDKLKIEVVALSQGYEQLSINFEEIKFKYHEVREARDREGEDRRGQDRIDRMNELNLLSRDSGTNSVQSDRDAVSEGLRTATAAEAMVYEREMFLEQIRASQKEIFGFRGRVDELVEERAVLQRENEELEQLLGGERVRGEKVDRQIFDILNKNQELRLEVVEERENARQAQEERDKAITALQEEGQRILEVLRQKDGLNSQLGESKTAISQLRLENSQLRESCSAGEERERELRVRVGELRRENEQLRGELQKMMVRLQETTASLERGRQQEAMRYRHEIQQHRNRATTLQRESKTKNSTAVHEISKMHRQITLKLQQKIHLLEKGGRQKKEKITQLKFEVERLYQSLQMQVEKEFKSAERVKELTERAAGLDKQLRTVAERLAKKEEEGERLDLSCKGMRHDLTKTTSKLKKLTQYTSKLSTVILPRLKEQLHSTRLLCGHFSAMVQLQKQQTSFLLLKRQENFRQLVEQSLLSRTLAKEQTGLAHQNEIARWKENCRNYEERYDQLKATFEVLDEKYSKLEILHADAVRVQGEREAVLQEENDRRRAEHAGTVRTVQKLREKCREVEQYYKLVQELSKENLALKGKLDAISCFSFKSPQKEPLDSTSKRQKNAHSEDPLGRYNKTASHLPRGGHMREEISVNDLTAKAEFQKLRLQAARREYNMINRVDT